MTTYLEQLQKAADDADKAIASLDRLRHTVEDIGGEMNERTEDLNDIRALLSRQIVRIRRRLSFERDEQRHTG